MNKLSASDVLLVRKAMGPFNSAPPITPACMPLQNHVHNQTDASCLGSYVPQARAVASKMSLPQRLMPLNLSALKLTLYKTFSQARGRDGPLTPAIASSSPSSRSQRSAGSTSLPPLPYRTTTTAAIPPPTVASTYTAFKDPPGTISSSVPGSVTRDAADTEFRPSIPSWPSTPPSLWPGGKVPSSEETVPDVQASPPSSPSRPKGLAPGAWNPSAVTKSRTDKRQRELTDRNTYLKNFWYAAGE